MAAKKPKNKIKRAPKPKPERKEVRENPGLGHNLETLRTEGADVVEQFLKLDESMQSDMAGYRSDFAKLYEEGANRLGIKKAATFRPQRGPVRPMLQSVGDSMAEELCAHGTLPEAKP